MNGGDFVVIQIAPILAQFPLRDYLIFGRATTQAGHPHFVHLNSRSQHVFLLTIILSCLVAEISKQHFKLTVTEDGAGLSLEDLSSHGTIVNNVKISDPSRGHHSEPIQVFVWRHLFPFSSHIGLGGRCYPGRYLHLQDQSSARTHKRN